MSNLTLENHPLAIGNPPSWAREWGQDRYGVFADFRVGAVQQRMRWIPPGTFWMGSPESEAGRFEREGPRHRVKLTEGFWLADTPCTQELWQEVIGKNPSYFKSPRRPVEQVRWDDCQSFLEAVNQRQTGLELRLPTEAQWERACRACTDTATWLGAPDVLEKSNVPSLDEIAWYVGNSGVDFDLEEDEDFDYSGWDEKQYSQTRAGTREVELKKPNPWGLYDMLGNVWEWCSDAWNEHYPTGSRIDPAAPEKGTERVIRGGAWGVDTRFVRAAYRIGFPPGKYDRDLGFRLSRGQ